MKCFSCRIQLQNEFLIYWNHAIWVHGYFHYKIKICLLSTLKMYLFIFKLEASTSNNESFTSELK
jgi:hypothetical protein